MALTEYLTSRRKLDCESCPLSRNCLPHSIEAKNLHQLEKVIEHPAPLRAGGYLFRQGDVFESLAIIRSGTVKTCSVDREGRDLTLGFHFPGDFIGLGAIDEGRHPSSAVALDTVTICRVPFRAAAEAAATTPLLMTHLFKLMSRDIARATHMSCNQTADERLAGFLIGMADRMAARGFSSSRWQLTMSRMDIASYLRLAPATLSRMIRRFQHEGLLAIEGREVEVRQRERLQALTTPAGRECSDSLASHH